MTATAALIVSALGWALLDFVWQGVVIGFATALVLRLLRDAGPQARYLVAVGAMALCLMLPVAQVGVAMIADAAPIAAAHVATVANDSIAVGKVTFAVPHAAWPQRLREQLPWLVTAWALGAALLTLRIALGLAWVRRVGRSSPDIADAVWQARLNQLAIRFGLTRPIGLRVSSDIDSPVAAGWWRPIVLVPAALVARMPPDLLEALLAHELAHIRRHDYLVNLAQSAVEALLFYHPVTWWLSRRIRVEREQIADDLAAHVLGEPRRLALALQELDRLQFSPSNLALAANGGHLMSRIQRLIRPHGRATTWNSLTWRLALPILALLAVCVTVYAHDKAPSTGESSAVDSFVAPTRSIVVSSNAVLAVTADAATDVVTSEVIRNEVPADDLAPVASADDVALLDAHTDAVVAPVTPVSPVSARITRVAPVPPVPTVSPVVMPRRSVHVSTESKGDGYAIVHANDADVTFSGNTRDLSEVEKLRARVGGDFLWFRRSGKSYIVRDPALVAQANAAWKPAEPVNAKMEALSRQMELHSSKMDALSRKMEATSRLGDPAAADMERTSAQMEAMSARQEQISSQQESLSARREALSGRIETLSRQREGVRSDAEREALQAQMERLHAQMQPLTVQMQQLSEKMRAQSEKMDAARKPMESISREMEQAAKPMQALGEQMELLGKQQEKLSLEADQKIKSLIDQAARTGQVQRAGSAAPR